MLDTTVEQINFILTILFFVCYAYQFFYLAVALVKKQAPLPEAAPRRIAVLIAARNEQAVIGQLIDSIRNQKYPRNKVDIFVVADNCTDLTGTVAGAHGATVYFRTNTAQVGKGYALQYLLSCMEEDCTPYDAYMVLDADNILAEDYMAQMNRTFASGYEIVTSYRNSKNYGDNWISAGYALWFLRESRYLNGARHLLHTSAAVSGTGFMFSRRILEKCGGWPFHLLTEDIEFTVSSIISGEKVGYCQNAVLYDEQPTDFRQSWRQRLRWSRGYLQVFRYYGRQLIGGIFRGSFSCYDMAMNIMPAAVLTGTGLVVNITAAIMNFVSGGSYAALGVSMLQIAMSLFGTLFVLGAVTTVTEWKNIHTTPAKKCLYALTFPLFMFTYLPICLVSLFKKPGWQPIVHTRSMALEQICQRRAG